MSDGSLTEIPQRGQGARDEAFKRLLWFVHNEPDFLQEYMVTTNRRFIGRTIWTLLSNG